MTGKIICQVCFKPLKTHGSIVAGMGPVCRERLRFAEDAELEILETMKGESEPPNSRSLLPFRNVIIEEKNSKNLTLSSILGVNNGNIILVDRQKLKETYSNSQSYSEAFSKCIKLVSNIEINSVHSINSPDHPQFRREFLQFQKKHKQKIQEREELIASNKAYELDYSFGNVESEKYLSEEQIKNRKEMLELKNTNNELFNQLYATAEFHLATFLTRLENSNFTELLEMRKILLKRYSPKIDVKDYGLTIDELSNGLQAANKPFEKNLYKAFTQGNTNLMGIIEIINRQSAMENADKMISIKIINTLTQDPYMSQGNKDSAFYDQVRAFIKKYNISVHSNWTK